MLLIGGVLATNSGGTIEAVSGGLSTVRLKDLENKGAFYVRGATTELDGAIKNTGSFTLKAGNTLRAFNTATLSGGGTIVMEASSKILSSSGTLSKIVNVSNKIIGQGEIGDGTLGIDNQNLIRAAGGTLGIRPEDSSFANTGTIEASSGAVLGFVGGGETRTIRNFGGTIHAQPGSVVVFQDNAWVVGGTLSASGNGLMGVPDSTTATLEAVTLDCTFEVDGVLVVENGRFGNGTIVAKPGAQLHIEQSQSFGRTTIYQSIVRSKPGGGSFSRSREADSYLINEGVFEGAGSLGINTLAVTNNGTILANVNVGSVGIENPLWINPSADGFTNNGIIEALGSGVAVLDGAAGGAFTQPGPGVIRATDAGSNVRLLNGPVLSGGMLGAGAGSVSVLGTATLANLISNATLVQVGIGTLRIDGNVTHNGSLTTPNIATLLIGGGSTFGGGSGAIVNNGSLIVSAGATLDVGSVEGTGRIIVQSGGQAKADTIGQGSLSIQNNSLAVLKSSAA